MFIEDVNNIARMLGFTAPAMLRFTCTPGQGVPFLGKLINLNYCMVLLYALIKINKVLELVCELLDLSSLVIMWAKCISGKILDVGIFRESADDKDGVRNRV